VIITPDEMNNISVFKKSIDQNRKSFENNVAKGEVTGNSGTFKSSFKEKIKNLKDGETIYLDKRGEGAGDYWDQDIRTWEGAKGSDIEQSTKIGAVKLRSQGRLKAQRHGDKILIAGTINHGVNDIYNFNEEAFWLGFWRNETKTGAKPFPIKGSRKDKVEGILKIKDKKIIDQNFEWVPIDHK